MKGRFTLDDTFAICCELQKSFYNLRFKNIYDLEDSHSYILKFENNLFITVRIGTCVFESKKHSSKRRLIPTSLCTKIRKHLKNKRLLDISMLQNDRVIKMEFGFQDSLEKDTSARFYVQKGATVEDTTLKNTARFYLLIELFSNGNLILTEPNYNILSVLRTHFYDKDNIVRSGKTYPLEKLGSTNRDKIYEEGDRFLQNQGYHTNSGCISAFELEKLCIEPPIIIRSSFKTFSEAVEEYYIQLFPSKQIGNIPKNQAKNKKGTSIDDKKENIIKFTQQKLQKLTCKLKYYELAIECIYQNLEGVTKLLLSRQQVSKDKTIKMSLTNAESKSIEITLELSKNVHQNIRNLFTKVKEIRQKIHKTKIGSEKALQQFDDQCKPKRGSVDKKVMINNDRKYWYQDYHWFITDKNHIVVSGKNCTQNEELVKKYLEKNDLYFHSTYAGGAITILKNPNQDEIAPFELEEAGAFATIHSKAWVEESPDNAYWVNASQVSKTTESGEYVEKGSFIIRGKRNLIRISTLELGIYIQKRNIFNRLEVAPYRTAYKYSNKCLKIVPGKSKRKVILQKIITKLNVKSKTKTSVFDILDRMIKYHICLR